MASWKIFNMNGMQQNGGMGKWQFLDFLCVMLMNCEMIVTGLIMTFPISYQKETDKYETFAQHWRYPVNFAMISTILPVVLMIQVEPAPCQCNVWSVQSPPTPYVPWMRPWLVFLCTPCIREIIMKKSRTRIKVNNRLTWNCKLETLNLRAKVVCTMTKRHICWLW